VHSSKAVELKEECPIGWWNAGVDTPSAMVYLNETIIFGGCYAQEHAGNKSLTTGPTRSLTMGPTATPRSEVSATTPKATSTALRNESDGRSKRVGWTIMGTGWIAAAVIGGW
jgi:hypothetical protein